MRIFLTSCLSMLMFISVAVYGETENRNKSKILIVYFSRVGNTQFDKNVDTVASASIIKGKDRLTGNTELIANMIKDELNADLFEIVAKKSYPRDYKETTSAARRELADNERPPLTAKVKNLNSYDTIFLGFPNWWGTMPMSVFTFLEEYNFSGKKIIPFCTHGGSSFGYALDDLKKISPKADILKGLAISDTEVQSSREEVRKWLKSLKM